MKSLKEFIYSNIIHDDKSFAVGLCADVALKHFHEDDLSKEDQFVLKKLVESPDNIVCGTICGVEIVRLPDIGIKCHDCDEVHRQVTFKTE